MSTAVLISGQMRSFARCYPSQRWQIFRHYEPDISFFVSCCDDAMADDAELLREHYKNVFIEKWKDPELAPIPIEYGEHAPFANANTHEKLLLQHWGNRRVWQFFQSQIANRKSQIDTIIRIRPDLFIHSYRSPITNHQSPDEWVAYCPWWGKFGGINDRLALMGIKAAEHYLTTYDKILDLLKRGCPFHPETLVKESMLAAGVDIHHSLMAEFSTVRTNGDMRWPEIRPYEHSDLIYELCSHRCRKN